MVARHHILKKHTHTLIFCQVIIAKHLNKFTSFDRSSTMFNAVLMSSIELRSMKEKKNVLKEKFIQRIFCGALQPTSTFTTKEKRVSTLNLRTFSDIEMKCAIESIVCI